MAVGTTVAQVLLLATVKANTIGLALTSPGTGVYVGAKVFALVNEPPPFTMFHETVPKLAEALLFKVTLLLTQALLISVPALATGILSLVMVISSKSDGQIPLVTVHLNVFAENPKLLTLVELLFGEAIVPEPDLKVHWPVPLVIGAAFKVIFPEQILKSAPASATDGCGVTVIVTSSELTFPLASVTVKV